MVQTRALPLRQLRHELLDTTEVPASDGTRFGINVRHGFSEIIAEVNTGTPIDTKLHLVPRMRECYYYDASQALGSRWTNLIADKNKTLINRQVAGITNATGGVGGGVGDFWYFGCVGKIQGLRVEVNVANATDTGAVPTGEHSEGANWAADTLTDTTDGAVDGKMFAADGLLLLSAVSTSWTASSLSQSLGKDVPVGGAGTEKLYWLRIGLPSGTDVLDAATSIDEFVPLSGDFNAAVTTDSDAIVLKGTGAGAATIEYSLPILLPAWVGGLELISTTTTGQTVMLTWIKR